MIVFNSAIHKLIIWKSSFANDSSSNKYHAVHVWGMMWEMGYRRASLFILAMTVSRGSLKTETRK